MPANTSPIFVLTPHNEGQQFVNADGTAKKTLYTPGANGSRIDRILITSNDTATVTLLFYVTVGGTDYHLGDVQITTLQGYDAALGVDALQTLLRNLGGAGVLPSGHVLKAAAKTAVTAAKVVDVYVAGGDF
jgi:hypothetical protein